MLCTPRTLLRGMADVRLWTAVLQWWSDQPSGRWWTLAEIAPHAPMSIEQLSWLLNAWHDEGWLERRTDSGRTMWRPTVEMPIVTPRQRPATQSWSDLFSAVAELLGWAL